MSRRKSQRALLSAKCAQVGQRLSQPRLIMLWIIVGTVGGTHIHRPAVARLAPVRFRQVKCHRFTIYCKGASVTSEESSLETDREHISPQHSRDV